MRSLFKIDSNKDNEMEIFYIEEDLVVEKQFDELFENLHNNEIGNKKRPKTCELHCPLYKKAHKKKQRQ